MFEKVNQGHPDKMTERVAGAIVEQARLYILTDCGGFERFAEWGLLRP